MGCIQTISNVVWPQLDKTFVFLLISCWPISSFTLLCHKRVWQLYAAAGAAPAPAASIRWLQREALQELPPSGCSHFLAHNQMVHSHTLTVCHIFPPAMSLLISVWNCCRWLPQMNARALGELKQIKSLAGPLMYYCLLQEERRNLSLPWTDQRPYSYSPEVGHLSSSPWAESNLTYVHQMVDSHNYYSAG